MQPLQLFLFGPPLTPKDLIITVVEDVVEGILNNLASAAAARWNANQVANEMNDAPSPVIFNGVAYCFYNSGNTLCFQYMNSSGAWVEGSGLPDITDCQSAPAAVVFGGQLYVFYPASSSNNINYIVSPDGSTWGSVLSTGVNTSSGNSPSAAVLNDLLYVFFTGSGGDQLCYATSSNGSSWTYMLAPNTGTTEGAGSNTTYLTNSPSVVAFNDALYVFHRGATGNGFNNSQLCYNMLNASGDWQGDRALSMEAYTQIFVSISASPDAFVFNDQIYVVFDCSGQLYNVTSSNGSSYSSPLLMGQIGLLNGPSVCAYNGQLVMTGVAPSANDGGGTMGYAVTTAGGNWAYMTPVLPENNVVVPLTMSNYMTGMTVFNGLLYCFSQAVGNQGTIQYLTFNGSSWSGVSFAALGGEVMSATPVPVVFNGGLYVFYEKQSNGHWTYYTYSADGSNWTDTINVKSTNLTNQPSPVVYDGSIYLFHTATDNENQIWFNVTTGGSGSGLTWKGDQEIPGFNTSTLWSDYNGDIPPVAVVFEGSLYLFYLTNPYAIAYRRYTGSGGSNNSSDWSNPWVVPNAYNTFNAGSLYQYNTTGSFLSVTPFTDANGTATLAVFFIPCGSSSEVWYATSTNPGSGSWSGFSQAGVTVPPGASASGNIGNIANWVVARCGGTPGDWWNVFT